MLLVCSVRLNGNGQRLQFVDKCLLPLLLLLRASPASLNMSVTE